MHVTLGKWQIFLRTPSTAYKGEISDQQTINEVRKIRLKAVSSTKILWDWMSWSNLAFMKIVKPIVLFALHYPSIHVFPKRFPLFLHTLLSLDTVNWSRSGQLTQAGPMSLCPEIFEKQSLSMT